MDEILSNVAKPSLGIMNLQQGEQRFQLSRITPSDDLAFLFDISGSLGGI